MNVQLIKTIIDFVIFLEFTEDTKLDPDVAIEALEQLAAELQLMSTEDRSELVKKIKILALEHTEDDKKTFVENLPLFLGLE